MEKDYIIIGFGLAGLAFAEMLENNNKSFVVISDQSQNSSHVAAGMFNPVILKRFTAVWNGTAQIDYALPFYKKIEEKLKLEKKIIKHIDILHVFKSVAQQNEWIIASDKPNISKYIEPKLITNTNKYINAPFKLGKLINTGKIETSILINTYKNYLLNKNCYLDHTFNHTDLKIETNTITYQNIKAKKIVFCEGFGVKQNPLFNYLPLNEAKGELLTIKAPNLNLKNMYKAAIFILPIGNDLYKVGATFNWTDKTIKPTKAGKDELIKKLKTVINTNFTVIEQHAGIRPTVKDRRPLVGTHKKYKNIAILNGLGTRGVMLAPTLANNLFNNLENNIMLDKIINIHRFN